jgi:hypothetical protein
VCVDTARPVSKDITWIDLKGLGLNSLKCLSVFSAINTACASNYPERSSKIFLLNAPRIFSSVWCAPLAQLSDLCLHVKGNSVTNTLSP